MRIALIILFIVSPVCVLAQENGNAAAGLAYARANCAECHAVVKDDGDSPNFAAPPFSSVAVMPGMTDRAVVVWLQTPHAEMPNFMVPVEDQANLAAYIMSLKPTPKL